MTDRMAHSQFQRPSQEQLKSTLAYLNYNGPVFSSYRSDPNTTEELKSSLKIIRSSAY